MVLLMQCYVHTSSGILTELNSNVHGMVECWSLACEFAVGHINVNMLVKELQPYVVHKNNDIDRNVYAIMYYIPGIDCFYGRGT